MVSRVNFLITRRPRVSSDDRPHSFCYIVGGDFKKSNYFSPFPFPLLPSRKSENANKNEATTTTITTTPQGHASTCDDHHPHNAHDPDHDRATDRPRQCPRHRPRGHATTTTTTTTTP